MRHNLAHKRLGRTTAHRLALFRNMLAALVNCDRIETTLGKARELRPLADKLITLAKNTKNNGSVASRRHAFSLLRDDTAVKKLFSSLADRFRERKGGYTRILKLGYRHGDCAPMAILEYLTAEIKSAAKEEKKSAKAKKVSKAPKKK
ncbi:MAG: 50S ribosomal protein L17 [Deltaproteobacteria bacterium]|nr:50S ribosomal protein L17 [Deltaproteobacteria bacterium]MBI2342418.1 50S ribosomal protein L17 [Deltaproteobacteria bacterium]MBI2975197.1 50S ribosomal protein L17 [Deltaproteobacteria bacterium]